MSATAFTPDNVNNVRWSLRRQTHTGALGTSFNHKWKPFDIEATELSHGLGQLTPLWLNTEPRQFANCDCFVLCGRENLGCWYCLTMTNVYETFSRYVTRGVIRVAMNITANCR